MRDTVGTDAVRLRSNALFRLPVRWIMLPRLFLLTALIAGAIFAASGCTDNTTGVASARPASPRDETSANIGGPLFPPKALPAAPPARSEFTVEPVLVPASVTIVDKVDIPTQRDGKILFIALGRDINFIHD